MLKMTRSILTLSAALVLLQACTDRRAARLDFNAPPSVTTDRAPATLNAVLVREGGTRLPKDPVSYSASPSGIVEVSPAGDLRCLKTGEALVMMRRGGKTATVSVKCPIDAEGKRPTGTANVLMQGPPRVGTSSGARARDRRRSAPSERPGPAQPSVKVVPAAAVLPELGRMVVSRPLDLKAGVTEILSLRTGTYIVEVLAKASDGSASGVMLSWMGAQCGDRPESQSHRVECTVAELANLSIANPRVSDGGDVSGYVNVTRVR